MEFNTDHCHTTQATRFDRDTTPNNPKSPRQQATPNVKAEYRLYRTCLREPAVNAGNEAAPSFMERVLALHTVTHAAKDMARTVFESESHGTEHKPQTASKTVGKSSPDLGSEIDFVLTDIVVVTKAIVDTIVESSPTNCTSTLQLQIVKAVESTFEDTLQKRYFNSNNGRKTAMFNVVEQVLNEGA